MKASTIFLLLFISQVWLFGQGNSLLNREVSASFNNTSIEEILKSLESEDLSFVYSPEVFDVKKRVTINRTNTRLSVVLTELFAGQQMEMREMRGQVLLRKKVFPKAEEKQESIDTAKVEETKVTPVTQAQKQDSILVEKPKTITKELQQDTLAIETKPPFQAVEDSIDSFGSNSGAEKGLVLAQTSSFIPQWPIPPYQSIISIPEPTGLNFSTVIPAYQKMDSDQSSIWDEVAETNKKSQAKERRQREKAVTEKKFRMGIGPYIGYTEFDQHDALLIGGKLMYYPSISFGVGLSGNALMSSAFFSEELNEDIRLEGGYGGLSFEYALFPKSFIHLNIPVTIGAGGFSYVKADQPFGMVGPRDAQAFFLFEAGAEIEINAAKFMKIGIGASYRDVSGSGILNQNTQVEIVSSSALEGMSYGLTLKFGRF